MSNHGRLVTDCQLGEGPQWRYARGRFGERPVLITSPHEHRDREVFRAAVGERQRLQHRGLPEILHVELDAPQYVLFEWLAGRKLSALRELVLAGVPAATAAIREVAFIIVDAGIEPHWISRLELDSIFLDEAGRISLSRLPQLPRGAEPDRSEAQVPFAYWSRDRVVGRPTDEASIPVMLAGLLCELATGHHPFERTNALETLGAVTEQRPQLPARDDAIDLWRLMDRTYEGAFETVASFLTALDEIITGDARTELAAWFERASARVDQDLEAAALLAEAEKRPDSVEPYLVYADHLQTTEEVRGELIVLQSEAVHAEDPRRRASLRKKQTAMIHRHSELLLGDAAPFFGLPPIAAAAELVDGGPHYVGKTTTGPFAGCWHMGFIRSVRVDLGWFYDPVNLRRSLHVLSNVESGKLIRELTIGRLHNSGNADYAWVYETFFPALLPIRSLLVGDLYRGFGPHEPTCVLDPTARIAAAFPELIRLALRGMNLRTMSPFRFDHLRELRIQVAGWSSRALQELAASTLPKLQYLELWLGTNYGRTAGASDMARLLDAEFPSLKQLTIAEQRPEATEHLVETLLRSPLLPQLEYLGLGKTELTPAALSLLWSERAAFEHLTLDVGVRNGGPAAPLGPRTSQTSDSDEVLLRSSPYRPRPGPPGS